MITSCRCYSCGGDIQAEPGIYGELRISQCKRCANGGKAMEVKAEPVEKGVGNCIKKKVINITQTTFEFSGEDIEDAIKRLLSKHIGNGEVSFSWGNNQYTSLSVVITKTEVVQES